MNKDLSLKDIPGLINSIDRKKVGTVVLILYAIVIISTILVHEPWWDEAQAFIIARDASYSDILFYLPHYEGHPPLWHLLLSVPAKLGVPYEITIKTYQVLFALLMVFLIEFKSPFNNLVKMTLPFTYFMVFQYGVIARPYALMLSAIFLVASFWQSRNDKPVRYILSMVLLCLTSAYGIAISGGIALAWVIEIIGEKREMFSNKKRLVRLTALLVLALLLVAEIYPYSDNIVSRINSFSLYKLLKIYSLYPSEVFFTDLIFNNDNISVAEYVFVGVITVLIWVVSIWFAYSRKILKYLILSFVFLSVVSSKHFSDHHLGVIFGIFIFIYWIGLTSSDSAPSRIRSRLIMAMTTVSIAISIYWGAVSCLNDYIYKYWFGQECCEYIAEKGFDQYTWASPWYISDEGIVFQTAGGNAVAVTAYYGNIEYINKPWNSGYQILKYMNDEEQEKYLNTVKTNKQPDFMLTTSSFVDRYKDYLGYEEDYHLINGFVSQKIYKTRLFSTGINIYARQGIIDELKLDVIE